MEHRLKISLTRQPIYDGVVTVRNVSVRERVMCFLLGEKQKLTIIVSGDTVHELAIQEIQEGGIL